MDGIIVMDGSILAEYPACSLLTKPSYLGLYLVSTRMHLNTLFAGSPFFYIYNLKIYNLTKHIYINDIIGSVIGMATLNDL